MQAPPNPFPPKRAAQSSFPSKLFRKGQGPGRPDRLEQACRASLAHPDVRRPAMHILSPAICRPCPERARKRRQEGRDAEDDGQDGAWPGQTCHRIVPGHEGVEPEAWQLEGALRSSCRQEEQERLSCSYPSPSTRRG